MAPRKHKPKFSFKGSSPWAPAEHELYFGKRQVYYEYIKGAFFNVLRRDIHRLKIALGLQNLADEDLLNPSDGVQTARLAVGVKDSRHILLVSRPGMRNITFMEAFQQTHTGTTQTQQASVAVGRSLRSSPQRLPVPTVKISPPKANVSQSSRKTPPSVGPSGGSRTLLHPGDASSRSTYGQMSGQGSITGTGRSVQAFAETAGSQMSSPPVIATARTLQPPANASQGPTRQTSPSVRPSAGSQTHMYPGNASVDRTQSVPRQLPALQEDSTSVESQGAGILKQSSKDASKLFFHLPEHAEGRPSLDDPLYMRQGDNFVPVCLAFTKNNDTGFQDDPVMRMHIKMLKELSDNRHATDAEYLVVVTLRPNEQNKPCLLVQGDIFTGSLAAQKGQFKNLTNGLVRRFRAAQETSTDYHLDGKDDWVRKRVIKK